MQMNLPNKLTTMRVILIPVFLLVLFLMDEPMNRYIATAIFIVASLTDFLDGHIARKYNLVSNFGKFMDPLADKLLVMSALVSMVAMEDLPAWVVIVILAREFAITGFRTLAMEAIFFNGKNIHDLGEKYRNILGYLPQNFGYYPNFTAYKFLMYISAPPLYTV